MLSATAILDGKLAVVVYGWNSGTQRGYGYLAGTRFNSGKIPTNSCHSA